MVINYGREGTTAEFSVIQSVSKPEQASQPEFDSSVRPQLRQHPKA